MGPKYKIIPLRPKKLSLDRKDFNPIMELEIKSMTLGLELGLRQRTAWQDSYDHRGEEAIRFYTRRTALWESQECYSRQHKDRNHPKALHADVSGLLTCMKAAGISA